MVLVVAVSCEKNKIVWAQTTLPNSDRSGIPDYLDKD